MSFIRRIYKKFIRRNMRSAEAVPDLSKWFQLFEQLPEPKDSIDIAYNKHLCRMTSFSVITKIAMNVLSLGAMLLALPRLLKKAGPGREVKKGSVLLQIYDTIGYQDIVPEELYTRFENVIVHEKKDVPVGCLVDAARKLFFEGLRRHPFSFWFNFLNLKELSHHSHYLLNYDMEACACYSYEKPTAGPMVTDMYEATGRKLICFMHGEYLLQLPHAYMKFSEFYVWDPMYIDMYTNQLKGYISEYRVYAPLKLQKKWHLEEYEPEYFCTYYFSGEKVDIMYRIAKIFNNLAEKGYKCKVRPHPRATTYLKEMKEAFKGVDIEMPKETSMHDSLANTKYVVSAISTVLSEAYVEGREIVIDDMSDPKLFASLRDRRAIVLTKKHVLLSDFCRAISQDTEWVE